MTTRRVTIHEARTLENDELLVVTVWEEQINKQELKMMNEYTKSHDVLIRRGHIFEFKQENA